MSSRKDLKILIVDDKPNMRRTIANMLRQIGYKDIRDADDGDTAMKLLMSHKFDFVICDWNMPRVKGVEVLKKMRSDETLKSIPFLMVTAEVEESTVAEAAESGLDGYIIKPFIPETLHNKMEGILEKRENPDELETKFQLGMTLFNVRQYDQALTTFQNVLEIAPNSPRAYHAIGQIYEGKNNMAAAQSAYQKALELSPQFIKAHERLAKIYEKSENPQKALEHIEAAIKISPKGSNRQVDCGKLHLAMGKTQQAKEAFDKAVKLEPDNAERLTEIGEAFLETGYSEDASKAFQSSLNLNPENIHVYNRLGIALRKQNKYDEAITAYKKALKIDPENEYVLFNIGRAYQEWGHKKDAIKYFKKALELYEDFPEAKAALKELGENA